MSHKLWLRSPEEKNKQSFLSSDIIFIDISAENRPEQAHTVFAEFLWQMYKPWLRIHL